MTLIIILANQPMTVWKINLAMKFKDLFKPTSSGSLWRITFILIIAYFLAVTLVSVAGLLEQNDYFQSLSAFIGWMVTLFLAILHFRETQNENEHGRREEVKKRLQIEAFQKINESVTLFSDIVTKVTTPYRTVFVSLNFSRVYDPSLVTSDLQKFREIVSQHNLMLWNGVTQFILSIESHEIAVIEYDHLRKFIQFRVDDAQEAINQFRSYIQQVDAEQLKSNSGFDSFEKECKKVERLLFDVVMYLFDYRIELMNELLGNVFEKTVPRRQPLDPEFKTLLQLATKERVEEESEKRNQNRGK